MGEGDASERQRLDELTPVKILPKGLAPLGGSRYEGDVHEALREATPTHMETARVQGLAQASFPLWEACGAAGQPVTI